MRGEFDGRGGQYDAKNAIRVLRLFKRWQYEGQDIHGVLLVRDHDGLSERLDWLIKAREHASDIAKLVVIGVARHERECWALTGFVPANRREEELIAALRLQLGFHPCVDSHRLTATEDHEEKSAKRVLDRLTEHSYEREKACWLQTPLATLRERGEASGLTAFLAEVEDRLVPQGDCATMGSLRRCRHGDSAGEGEDADRRGAT